LKRWAPRPGPRPQPSFRTPTLLEFLENKVRDLRIALNDPAVPTQASETLSSLIDSVTVHPGEQPDAEGAGDIVKLLALAANENCPRSRRARGLFCYGGCGSRI